ncbi:MAG: ABC transporter ATP-binding protein [Burkholderiaceae bacterium]
MLIELTDCCKSYWMGQVEVPVLRDISLSVAAGEFLAVVGPSGSGKSTLLNILGCLDNMDRGRYRLGGEVIDQASSKALSKIRNQRFGFVFQQFSLVPRLNALSNVELPLMYAGVNHRQRTRRATEMLDRVGLADRASHSPMELSGGQQQRVAIARALANEPDILIADEPTGALDSTTGKEILQIFEDLARAGKTVIIVTHDSAVAARCDREIEIADGRIRNDKRR